jgi:predicted outer membrane repeat protein
VFVAGVSEQFKVLGIFHAASLTLDGGIVENNKGENSGGGIFVAGAFTMKGGSVRNNTTVPDKDGLTAGGGIYITSSEPVTIEGGDVTGNTAGTGGGIFISEGRVTMTGGTVSGNTATKAIGGVAVYAGATFNPRGGTISGNTAPSSTPSETHNIFRMPGSFGTSTGGASTGSSGTSSGSSSSTTPAPASGRQHVRCRRFLLHRGLRAA